MSLFTPKFRFLILLMVGLFISACGGSKESHETAANTESEKEAETEAVGNKSGDNLALVEPCLATTNWSEALCACVSKKAHEELSENAYDFLVATLDKNEDELERLRKVLTIQETIQAGLYMTKGPEHCQDVLQSGSN